MELWAVKMLNSWGKLPAPGFLSGAVSDVGSYDQCLQQSNDKQLVKPKYCLLDFVPPMVDTPDNLNIFHKITLIDPKLNISANNVFRHIEDNIAYLYYISWRVGIFAIDWHIVNRKIHCETQQTFSIDLLTGIQWFALSVLFAFILLNITSTLLDIYQNDWPLHIDWIITAFSMRHNLHKLMSTDTESQSLSCIHGIRVVTITWVILGHCMLYSNYQAFDRTFDSRHIFTAIDLQPFLNTSYGVDTFFVISGILTTYVTFSITNGDRNGFSMLGYLMSRYLRLTPLLGLFILFTFLLPLVSSGPYWHETVEPIIDRCTTNWWLNLIYLQNYINVDQICLLHTWYLSCDMQFHIISLLIIIAFYRSRSAGMSLNTAVMIGFGLTTAAIIYVRQFPPAVINTQRSTLWLIMGCVSGYGRPVNTFLSWKAFVPLSRLTYSVYLTHVWWLWTFMGTLRERVDLSRYSMSMIFLSIWLGSYLLAFIFALIVEYPILHIQKKISTKVIASGN
ncbi:nose resistant to fluoxetine protein 6-like [Oppia nitens]|uniref:nose resistant to fluoxetine protein 6-like n=1 Tax=Oppia nitens TaxID=1686743 RepID=UPI0023DB313E|nr:nose resistant to fluoxetine protein 6-like [Oppia nitens]